MDSRKIRNNESVKSLYQLLLDMRENPKEYASGKEFLGILKSQGKISKYEDLKKCIISMSLNTLKRTAEENIPGGFAQFDALRITVLEKLEWYARQANVTKKPTKHSLKLKSEKLHHENLSLKEDLVRLTYALKLSISYGFKYASASKEAYMIDQWRADQKFIMNSIQLSSANRDEPESNE